MTLPVASSYSVVCVIFRLAGLPVILPDEQAGSKHSYHLFVVRAPQARDRFEAHLWKNGIATGRHYPWPVHRQPGIASHAKIPQPLSVTERIAEEIVSLPMFATMSESQADRVVDAIRKFYR